MSLLQKITAKELAIEMNISVKSAHRLLKDIKTELELKKVCMYHVKQYLQIPHAQSLS